MTLAYFSWQTGQNKHNLTTMSACNSHILPPYAATFSDYDMKRALSCPDLDKTRSRPPFPKRRKLSPSGSCRCCLSSTTSQSLQTLPLTPQTLQAHSSQTSALQGHTQFIEQWVNDCDSYGEAEMAPPQTPSVISNESGQRRTSKLNYRRQRSQSPSKKTSPQYRSRNMADASVFIDHFPEPPQDVDDQLKHIFDVSVLEDIGKTSFSCDLYATLAAQNRVGELSERYCHKSRQMAKDCAGEGQWKSCLLSGLVEPIQELWPDVIKISASEKRRCTRSTLAMWLMLP